MKFELIWSVLQLYQSGLVKSVAPCSTPSFINSPVDSYHKGSVEFAIIVSATLADTSTPTSPATLPVALRTALRGAVIPTIFNIAKDLIALYIILAVFRCAFITGVSISDTILFEITAMRFFLFLIIVSREPIIDFSSKDMFLRILLIILTSDARRCFVVLPRNFNFSTLNVSNLAESSILSLLILSTR